MSTEARPLIIGSSPHIRVKQSVPDIMFHVALALLPVAAFAVWSFGLSALLLLLTTTAACVATEHTACLIARRSTTIRDWSVVVTGLILGLTLPPSTPLWMAVLGSIFGVSVTKSLFGGLGYNCFNPALVGRAFLQIAFPIPLTTWTPPDLPGRFSSLLPTTLTFPFLRADTAALADYIRTALASGGVDGWSGATPLSMWKFAEVPQFESLPRLFLGSIAGSTGETATWLIILCGLYLIARNMMNWRIPAGMLLGAFLLSGAFWLSDKTHYPSPMFMLFSGGLMFGALFMASDMVASPMTSAGVWIYGFFIGMVTVIIRIFGALPEGVMFAILLGNAVSPLITSATQPRTYGLVRQKRWIKQ
ncbi:MAG TPA: RnfABCDGE type electron transport complex subunit D [Candidatus Hydrogenedentes bacterium]|jgi:electron transport complex protein RnfD|nr:MAG: Electron transport complex protein RnfD [Candidatus Hydrogenedentes bacterium ADurb.Bin170]HNZ48884.1 RnfABCDGE type electron transport complex subunit D [Candidatus Hydrogenedentota bacterium]HOD94761.1 RnfABCDGE type electron transport complex subunit D [Candidatus Hydrogenedentota bacterium]HOM49078.1 RnfABCDGE type electron transport complex subunit D [Candidatus Hydrogenedentota bacterium]HOR50217.1 RnfABCDGE type electron transport complex subunit D [Candidatus Hydrogenedentota ba